MYAVIEIEATSGETQTIATNLALEAAEELVSEARVGYIRMKMPMNER